MSNVNFGEFFAGDSVSSVDNYSDFLPSDGWTVEYILSNKDGKIILNNGIEIIPDVDNNTYVVTLDSATTEGFEAGRYRLNAIFTNTSLSQRKTVYIQEVLIKNDLFTVDAEDVRAWQEIALENLQAYFTNKATLQQREYEINGRKLVSHSPNELRGLYTWLQSEVNKLHAKAGKKSKHKIYVQFTNN